MRTLVLLVALLVSTTFAGAAEDIAAGQAVIRSQERAFGRDDATTAYTFASPSKKSQYWNSEAFMHMVRNGYAPIYRHRSFKFGGARISEGKILQEVHIVVWNQRLWKGFRMTAQGCVFAPQGASHRAKLVPASVMRTKRLWNQRLWKGFRMTAQGCVSAPQGASHRAKLVPASVRWRLSLRSFM
jgi:hypothetical protein